MMKYSKELIDLVGEIPSSGFSPTKKFKNLIKFETGFLSDSTKIRERMYYVLRDTKQIVKCPICQNDTHIKYVNLEYIIQTCSVVCRTKKLKLVESDGLTTYQRSRIQLKIKMSKIDPNIGLTGYQKSGRKVKDSLSKVDLKTGLRPRDIIAIKTKARMSKIDSETGLTGSQVISNTVKNSLSKIDPNTRLTKSQEIGKKVNSAMSKIDSETGLTGYQAMGKNVSTTLNKIDPITKLTKAQTNGLKSKLTLSKVNHSTGLTGYQTSAIKTKIIRSKISNSDGLTSYQRSGIKTKEKMMKVNPNTGLTGYKLNSNIAKISNRNRGFKSIYREFDVGYKLLTTKDEYIKSDSNLLRYSCDKCDSIRESYWPYIRCTKCYPYNRSIGENEVLEFCQTLTSEVQSNPRDIISPLELDVYIPNHNLAIEYDGVFWHSSYSIETESEDYHLYKTKQCKSKGIQLFHIFENEWLDPQKRLIWKSIIRNKLGNSQRIFARKTKVTRITSKETKTFIDSNHLQGACVSSVNLGLIYDDELVAVMTFGRSRYDKGVDWELLRYCGKLGTSVVGGASKLLTQFRRDNVGSIISYADKRRSSGNLYDRLGFELSHESTPNYWYYIDPMILESRIGYQKHKLKDKLELFDDNLSESQNMYMNGYRKIYDCGNQVWKLK